MSFVFSPFSMSSDVRAEMKNRIGSKLFFGSDVANPPSARKEPVWPSFSGRRFAACGLSQLRAGVKSAETFFGNKTSGQKQNFVFFEMCPADVDGVAGC
jgi:hypothetical protein